MNNEASYYGGVYNRRVRALRRLEDQLKKGVKKVKATLRPENKSDYDHIPLEEVDVKRIKKEITTLKSKI
jgi:hypothetical protein